MLFVARKQRISLSSFVCAVLASMHFDKWNGLGEKMKVMIGNDAFLDGSIKFAGNLLTKEMISPQSD